MFQGAEARIYFIDHQGTQAVKKKRFAKSYRHPELDKKLTKTRTKAEVKALGSLKARSQDLSEHIPVVLWSSHDEIVMTRLTGYQTLHDALVKGKKVTHSHSLKSFHLFFREGK